MTPGEGAGAQGIREAAQKAVAAWNAWNDPRNVLDFPSDEWLDAMSDLEEALAAPKVEAGPWVLVIDGKSYAVPEPVFRENTVLLRDLEAALKNPVREAGREGDQDLSASGRLKPELLPHPGKPGRWICAGCSVDVFPTDYACPTPNCRLKSSPPQYPVRPFQILKAAKEAVSEYKSMRRASERARACESARAGTRGGRRTTVEAQYTRCAESYERARKHLEELCESVHYNGIAFRDEENHDA